MNILNKILNGTPSSINLCESCRFFIKIQGIRDSDQINKCNILEKQINFPVAKCGAYEEQDIRFNEFTRIGLNLDFDKKSQKLLINTGMFQDPLTIEEYIKIKKKHPSGNNK